MSENARRWFNMEMEKVIEKAKAIKKGAFVKIEFYSDPKKLAAGKTVEIVKKSKGVFRLGINYAHLKINAGKVTGELMGKVWKDGDTNYILQSEKTGKYMLRVYTTKTATRSEWFENGVKTTKQALVDRKLVSDRKSGFTPCFDLAIENIISIG